MSTNSKASGLTLLFPYTKISRYSVYALAGAMDVSPALHDVPVEFYMMTNGLAKRVGQLIGEGRQVVVGISLMTMRVQEFGRLIPALRDMAGDSDALLIVAGGPHPTAEPEGTLALGADIAVQGEGETVFVELMERLVQGDDWRETRGICWRDSQGTVRKNAKPAQVNLDTYPPFPARLGKFGHIEITRGCPFACAFCQVGHLHGMRPRHRSVEAIVRSVKVMRDAGRCDYRFITPNAFGYGSPDGRELRVDAIEHLLRSVRDAAGDDGRIYFGSFPSEARPEHVRPETVALVQRYADNNTLLMGAQSGSDIMLKRCHRGHTVDDVRQAIGHIINAKMQASVDFIFGLPGETERDREETVAFMEELVESGARIHTHTFMPIPQTAFSAERPGRARGALRESLLQRLMPSGVAYGNWQEQEALARQVARQRTQGK